MTNSRKLNNSIRDLIIDEALRESFGGKESQLQKLKFEVSLKLYNDIYSEKEREKMKNLPNGWLPIKNSFRVVMGGYGHTQIYLETDLLFFDFHMSYGRPVKVYSEGDNLFSIYDSYEKINTEVVGKRGKAYKMLRALLYSVKTTGQLKKIWAEGVKYIEKFEVTGETTQVAIQTKELTEILNEYKDKK
jgi:hypothetical protein